jgi:phosphatidylserine decarboxylase
LSAVLAPGRGQAHQFIHRSDGGVGTERLVYDRHIRWLYSEVREYAPRVFRWLTNSSHANELLARINFDRPFKHAGTLGVLARETGLDLSETVSPLPEKPTWREVFCRQIRYWELRPMPNDARAIVVPSDSRLLTGEFSDQERLPIKSKWFTVRDLLGEQSPALRRLQHGRWALFRLTPECYHYNHVPVSGTVQDIYSIAGGYHSCNPAVAGGGFDALSKNLRVVTLIDTDVPGGSRIGLVAMVEVAALLIGRVIQCYSEDAYESPTGLYPGQFVERGAVKSVFEPGSSSVVLLFEQGRICIDEDICANQRRTDVASRFSEVFAVPMVETQVRVRSQFARAVW